MELLRARKIILAPLTTEKNLARQEALRQYAFRVARNANKIDIKAAVENLFKVKVLRVNTSHVDGKNKRVRFQIGKTSSWKKAVVQLRPEDKIEFV
jgi:large subunit ribosomal protein L23